MPYLYAVYVNVTGAVGTPGVAVIGATGSIATDPDIFQLPDIDTGILFYPMYVII